MTFNLAAATTSTPPGGPNFGEDAALTVRSHEQFRRFFPQWNAGLQAVLASPACAPAAAQYFNTSDTSRHAVYAVIACLLDATPNFRVAEMSVSSVVLGLAPPLIQALGATTLQTSLMSLRRPLLALLLCAGSPAIRPLPSGDYVREIRRLGDPTSGWYPRALRRGTVDSASPSWWWWARRAVGLAEYGAALAAAGNVALLAYQLGYWSVSIFAVAETWLPLLWTYLGLAIHVVGIASLRLLVHVQQESLPSDIRHEGRAPSLVRWLSRELTPAVYHRVTTLRARKDGPWFYVITWSLYVVTSVHILFGTLVLASMLFISLSDAVGIVGRYVLSTVVCRLVLEFELVGMGQDRVRMVASDVTNGTHSSMELDELNVVSSGSNG